MPGGGTRGQNLAHFQNEVFNPYLDNHLSESIQTWTRGTMLGKLSIHDICQGVGPEVKI